MRRYMAPQRDVYARLASERLPWMSDDQRRRMQDIAERLGRGLDEIDSCIARTAIMSDEIAQIMQESLARRTYTMSLMAMVFLPSTFLTGLFGVNLVNTRSNLLGAGDVLDAAALDKYSYIRDAYIQRRRNQVFDGRPPRDDDY